jgi:polygalacturonase
MAVLCNRISRRWRIATLIVLILAVSGCSAAYAGRENATGKRAGRTEHAGKVFGGGRRSTTTTTTTTTIPAEPVGDQAGAAEAGATTTTDGTGGKSVGTTAPKPAPTAAPTTTRAPAATRTTAPTTTSPPPSTSRAPASAAPTSRTPSGPTISVTDFGAVPDDGRDDQDAIQEAIDSAPEGTTVLFPAGTYHHSHLLQVRTDRVALWGYDAALVGTNREKHAIVLWGDYTSVVGLTISANPTGRLHAEDQMGISLHFTTGSVVRDTTVRNTSSAGIFIWGASDYQILNNVVENTMSDGIHSVGGARNGLVQGNRLRNVGDDCFAVISYLSERRMSGNITIRDNSCVGGKARGISVVGGEDVRIENNTIEASAAAGVYLASEDNYNTYGAHRVQVIGNRLIGVNTNSAIRHGAIFLWARSGSATTSDGKSHSLQNHDILIQGNTIEGTVTGAAHIVGQGGDSVRVNFVGNRTSGGRHAYLELRKDQYNQVDEQHDGDPVGDYVGNAAILP